MAAIVHRVNLSHRFGDILTRAFALSAINFTVSRRQASISSVVPRPSTKNRIEGNQELQMETLIVGLEMPRRLLRRIGPYVLLEMLLPGGTLLALLLYLYQRWDASITGLLPHGSGVSAIGEPY
jgi:hypothetical protein